MTHHAKSLYLILLNIREASIAGTLLLRYLNRLFQTTFSYGMAKNCFNCNGLKEWDVMSARVDDAARILFSG